MIKILNNDSSISEIEYDEKIEIARHSASHVLAEAVKKIYPNVKLAIGPAVEEGFYYDFDNLNITTDDLKKIENVMKNIIKEKKEMKVYEIEYKGAIKKMEAEPYKLEMIEDLKKESGKITFYDNGTFVDMCKGPHLLNLKDIGEVKLLSVTGAYWKGSEKNKMLTRIYGTCFETKEKLEKYIEMKEEAKKRDHRKIAKELDLFMMVDEGPGFPFFLPKGMVLRNILEDFWRKTHIKNGYQEIKTPILLNQELWHQSGHWDHYKDNMYSTEIDNTSFSLKPMNCPGGMLVYKRKLHSYRDLPKRVGELGLVHRHELSGTLHGLMRVRCFTQDDAHIFCLPEQVENEIVKLMKLIDKVYTIFGFEYKVELSTRPNDSMGTDKQWELAISALKHALDLQGVEYKINEGDGAFYGPKIDFHLKDCIGRTWQCGTIQLDFQMPERFDLAYIGQDGEKHRPVILHRVIFGSIERFIGILIEHYAGAFPLWLSPIQLKILTISDAQIEYAKKIKEKLQHEGFRVELDSENEKIGYKIRNARLEKTPYMLIIGDTEVQDEKVSIKSRTGEDLGKMELDELILKLNEEIKENLEK